MPEPALRAPYLERAAMIYNAILMPITLPQSLKTILLDKAYGHVVTFNASGRPQITMVWMDVDGDEVLFNTSEGRRKTQNLRRDPRVIVSMQDRNNPQSYAVFHGKARIVEQGANDHIDALTKRFLGPNVPTVRQPTDKRVIVRISVDRVSGAGPGYKPWT
ncbi:MAG: PPOX class F420-dependent oxidoreductase [Acidobacteria bacterium]|nr:PPOX class F420-dependent oxidoreductase [Acidobacteriota bacterium]